VMGRLGIIQEKHLQNSSEPIRVTLLSRGTKFRKILNEKEVRVILDLFGVIGVGITNSFYVLIFLK